MLVLSRKKNESIKIADNITVTVIDIRGDKVRLGIDAPKEIAVHRTEVWAAIQAEQAAGGTPYHPSARPAAEPTAEPPQEGGPHPCES